MMIIIIITMIMIIIIMIIIYHLIAWQEESVVVLPFNKSMSCVAVRLTRLYMLIVKFPKEYFVLERLPFFTCTVANRTFPPSSSSVHISFTTFTFEQHRHRHRHQLPAYILVRAKYGRLKWPPGLLRNSSGDWLNFGPMHCIAMYQFVPIFSMNGWRRCGIWGNCWIQ